MSDTVRSRVVRWSGAFDGEDTDELAAEEPLEIRIGSRPVSITMRTPGHDLELVAGFLLSEGLLAPGALPVLRHEHPNVVNVACDSVPAGALASLTRHVFTSSSCGMCGRASLDAVHRQFDPLADGLRIEASFLPSLLERLEATQSAFSKTGGVHAAAVFSPAELVAAREDVGRHNAVDKAIGYALLRGLLPLAEHVLLVSGRASFEIIQKAVAAGIPVVAAVSAPSSLAVQLAEESGVTLVGFLRGGRFNIYAHPERIR